MMCYLFSMDPDYEWWADYEDHEMHSQENGTRDCAVVFRWSQKIIKQQWLVCLRFIVGIFNLRNFASWRQELLKDEILFLIWFQ
jgi:hypothetical protein